MDASLRASYIGVCLLVCFAVYYLRNGWEWERNARHLLAYGRYTPHIRPIGTKRLSKPDNKNPSDGHPLNLWNPPYLVEHGTKDYLSTSVNFQTQEERDSATQRFKAILLCLLVLLFDHSKAREM